MALKVGQSVNDPVDGLAERIWQTYIGLIGTSAFDQTRIRSIFQTIATAVIDEIRANAEVVADSSPPVIGQPPAPARVR